MGRIITTIMLLGLVATAAAAETGDSLVTQNAAFYSGESLNYIFQPPAKFRMVEQEAAEDGFSFAFIPEGSNYAESDVMIGVNIFKTRGLKFDDVVKEDTATMRAHYGKNVRIWAVDSILLGSGQVLPTFYVNDEKRFIPNVMIAYLNGDSELIIFELIISEKALRTDAERAFVDCLRNSKALERRQLGAK